MKTIAPAPFAAEMAPSHVGAALRLQVQSRPASEAVAFAGRKYSYAELDERSRSIARQLSELGVKRGDRVAILFINHYQYVACFFAVSGLGAVVVPVNPLLRSEEIAHVLADSEAAAVITHECGIEEVQAALTFSPSVKHVLAYCETADRKALPPESPVFKPLVELPAGDFVWPQINRSAGDLAVLVYTSGTTGKPKGAMLTHQNLIHAVQSASKVLRAESSDRFLAVLPLCHIYGLTVVMLGVLSHGGTLVVQEKFDARATLELIAREKVTLVPMVPAMYQFSLMELENCRHDLSSVRVCLSGASALPPELIDKIENAFGAPLIEGYGLTEVACMGNANPFEGPRKAGSVGPPFPGMEVAVFDDSGNPLPPGRENVGEIGISGPSVMLGYHKQPEATAEVLRDGWFFTGDLGYQDEDGYLFIVGRKKEMIIRGGQNIYPREIEDVILRMPQVAEAAVIGVPDKFMGERVKAIVAVRPGQTVSEEDVKAHCAGLLAEYKVPRLVEFVDCLPRNSTGKVLKRLLG